MVDILRLQRSAHQQIIRFGRGPNNGSLVRAGVSRTITCARMEYKPTERGLYLDGSSRFAVSTIGQANLPLDPIPDHELDTLQFDNGVYTIIQPPLGPRPDGRWIFYQLICMFQETF